MLCTDLSCPDIPSDRHRSQISTLSFGTKGFIEGITGVVIWLTRLIGILTKSPLNFKQHSSFNGLFHSLLRPLEPCALHDIVVSISLSTAVGPPEPPLSF